MLDIIGVQLLDDTLHDGFGSKCSTEKKQNGLYGTPFFRTQLL